MGNIVLLDELTINKIAAGEVIERPASVVKELVENSIDAGATNISVEIKNGGISYIRITDNGKGIALDDMDMAFERHATSKIRQADDLETVTSMGFRGEALASISSISQMEVISKTKDSSLGCKVIVRGGQMLSREEAGCPQGTTMTITDLFYNTPVRYKFLKKDFTEAGYIEDVVTRIALVHPEIAIKLVNSGKTIIKTSGNGDMKSVIYSIYGKDIAENIIEVDYNFEDMRVAGVIGKPVIARSNRSNQLFFVNKRHIKDKILTSAAEQGYKGLITIGKYGFLVLNIEMNPRKVDVNVHPAKLEVRFEDESSVFKAIYHSIKDSLLKGDLIPNRDRMENNQEERKTFVANPVSNIVQKNEQEINGVNDDKLDNNVFSGNTKNESNTFLSNLKTENNDTSTNKINEEMKENEVKEVREKASKTEEASDNLIEQLYNFRNEMKSLGLVEPLNATNILAEYEKKDEDMKIASDSSIDDTTKVETSGYNNWVNNQETKVIDLSDINKKMDELSNLQVEADYQNFDEMYARTFGVTKKETKVEEENVEYKLRQDEIKTVENISIFDKVNKETTVSYKFIGIAFSTYIIIEMDKELYIIDQHAAHERIMYERIKENYYSDEERDSQLMLLPDIINLTHRDMEIARDNMDIFRKAGFVLEEFGENTIKLTGVPNMCIDLETRELFLETLDEINTVARTAKQEVEEKFIATVACKAAVKANMALTKEEVDELMKQLLVLQNPFTCPHGRPTAIKMTKIDIEKKFSRR